MEDDRTNELHLHVNPVIRHRKVVSAIQSVKCDIYHDFLCFPGRPTTFLCVCVRMCVTICVCDFEACVSICVLRVPDSNCECELGFTEREL